MPSYLCIFSFSYIQCALTNCFKDIHKNQQAKTANTQPSRKGQILFSDWLNIRNIQFSHWPRVIGYLWLSFTFSNHIHSSKFNHSKFCNNIILVLAAPLFMHVCVHFFMTNILYIFSSSCLAGWLL